jgi:sugar O-acyltransferase (sialic acid O-acetyltransferase NeuD family)
MNLKKLIIVGAGGAGLEALFVAERTGEWEVEGFADDAPHLAGMSVMGRPVLGSLEQVCHKYRDAGMYFHGALGRNSLRKSKVEMFERAGWLAATLIDASAVVAGSARVGEGSYIGPQAFVGPQAVVQRHVLVNVGASVGHHSVVQDFAQLCPGARVSGNVRLEEGVFIGSNGVVIPGVTVGAWSVVGASSLALKNLESNATVVGVPARMVAPGR